MNKARIRHMVIFCLKHDFNTAEASKFFEDAKRILTSIPGVEKFEMMNQVSKKNDFHYGFSMEFSNQESYDNYNKHDLHVNFVNQRWNTEVTKFLEIDFMTLT